MGVRAVPRLCIHLSYNWGKSRKTSVRVAERRSADPNAIRFVDMAIAGMASTGLMVPAALRLRVRRLGQPSVSVDFLVYTSIYVPPVHSVASRAKFDLWRNYCLRRGVSAHRTLRRWSYCEECDCDEVFMFSERWDLNCLVLFTWTCPKECWKGNCT